MTAVARSTEGGLASTTQAPASTPSSAPSLLTLSKGAHVLHFPDWSGPTSTSETRSRFLDALRISMSSVGFFYLNDSPLEPLRERLFEVNRRFFALPLETRMSIRMEESPHFRGYSPFGAERTMGQVDHRDQIDYGRELVARGAKSIPHYLRLIGPNQFLPDSILPGHRDAVLSYMSAANALSHSLTSALEAALGVTPGVLLQILRGSDGAGYERLKTIRYPSGAEVDGIKRAGNEGGAQGVGPHRDGGWLTLLATDPAKGLQVQLPDSTWVDVPHLPGSIIVNAGQQVERVTRGAIVAATHRVLASGEERYSIAWFGAPALDHIVKPLSVEELGPEMLKAIEQARAEREGREVQSDVVKGDLWGADTEVFGVPAWKGISRSHPYVVERWHQD